VREGRHQGVGLSFPAAPGDKADVPTGTSGFQPLLARRAGVSHGLLTNQMQTQQVQRQFGSSAFRDVGIADQRVLTGFEQIVARHRDIGRG